MEPERPEGDQEGVPKGVPEGVLEGAPGRGPAGDSAAPSAPAASRDHTPPPKIDPIVFARKREALQGRAPLSSMPRLLAAGIETQGSLDWDVEGSVGRDEMQRQRELLRVRTRFAPWTTCSRCLEPLQGRELSTDTLYRMAASEEQAAREDREADSFDVIAATPSLDLSALVEDEAILALPMAPAHDGCKWQAPAGWSMDSDV